MWFWIIWILCYHTFGLGDQDSTASIATRYQQDGPGIFHTCPDQPWGPFSLPYNGYWVSFPGVRQLGGGADQPSLSGAKVTERVEIYLYSPTGSSWQVTGWTLPLTFTFTILCYHNLTLLRVCVAAVSYRCL